MIRVSTTIFLVICLLLSRFHLYKCQTIVQNVLEGQNVRLICNATSRPDGGPISYEWEKPAGVIIGTDMRYVILGIRMDQAGLYTCKASQFAAGELRKRTQSTLIMVNRAAPVDEVFEIVFPEARNGSFSVFESGVAFIQCSIEGSSADNYRFRWIGPKNDVITEEASLYKSYIKAEDQGTYYCEVTHKTSQKTERKSLQLTVRALQLNVAIIEESLHLGGFVRRRCELGKSVVSYETFRYLWLDPRRQPISEGQDLVVQLTSQDKFGTYYCQATGENIRSTFEIETKITVENPDVAPPAPQYTIDVVKSPETITRNGEAVLVCRLQPPTSGVSYTWLKNGVKYSSVPVIRFPQFQASDVGNYECLAAPPGVTALRKAAYLQISAEVPDTGTGGQVGSGGIVGGGSYTVHIRWAPDPVRIFSAFTLTCYLQPPAERATYDWYKNGVRVGTEQNLRFSVFTKEDLGPYECRAYAPGATIAIKDSTIIKIGLYPSNTVDVAESPGTQMIVRLRDRKEIHCEVNRTRFPNSKGAEIQWYFNDALIDDTAKDRYGIWRIDRDYVSILVLRDIRTRNEGKYRCRLGNFDRETTVITMSETKSIEANPPSLVVNEGQAAEFHCRIEGFENILNVDLRWEFESRDGSKRYVLPSTTKWIRRDDETTQQTSFIFLDKALLADSGYYICSEPSGQTKRTELIVIAPRASDLIITVTPRTLRLRVGQRVGIECFSRDLSNQPVGDPQFYFQGKNSLSRDLRFRIQAMGQSHIAVDVLDGLNMQDNGTRLECWVGNKLESAIILIEDICAPGFRRCRSGGCVQMGRFCDKQRDCADGSDEDPSYCRECDPLTKTCETTNGKHPTTRFFQAQWECDGEDDCGNGYDESQCIGHMQTCDSMKYRCPGTDTQIPKAFMCDEEPDCPHGEDESSCRVPTMLTTATEGRIEARGGQTVTLTCEAAGNPLPFIIWRFNWGCLYDSNRMLVTTSYSNCASTVSTLIITDFRGGDDGIYNCEALSGHSRVWSKDFHVVLKNV